MTVSNKEARKTVEPTVIEKLLTPTLEARLDALMSAPYALDKRQLAEMRRLLMQRGMGDLP